MFAYAYGCKGTDRGRAGLSACKHFYHSLPCQPESYLARTLLLLFGTEQE